MQISQNGLDFIKSFEGYHTRLSDGRCTTYYCPAGVLTIGYGSTNSDGLGRINPGDIWTYEQAMQRLRDSMARNYEPSVKRLTQHLTLTQAQYDMLVSFTYNCGEGCLRQLLTRKTIKDIADALLLFVRGGGKVLPGLVRRRQEERQIFLRGYKQDMAQSVEPVTRKEFKKEVQKGSLKSRVGLWVRGAITFVTGLFTVGNLTFLKDTADTLKGFASEYWLPMIMAVSFGAWMLLKWYETRQIQDAIEGNYVPSSVAANDNELVEVPREAA